MASEQARALHVGTRKGLLTYGRERGLWQLGATAFLGEPVSAILPDPRDGALYVALNLGHFGVKLHRSDDGGASWKELPAPAFAAAPAPSGTPDDGTGTPDDGTGAPSVSLIWTLVAGGADRPGEIWAGTIPGGLFRSADRGESWSLIESLWTHPAREKWLGGGYDDPGIHSICVDPRDSRKMILGVSTGGVWRTDDGAGSWTIATGMRNAYMPPGQEYDPIFQDAHRLSHCAGAPDTVWCQHHNGIFRSTDGARSFTEITADAPSLFGFAVLAHPDDPDTAWFVPAVKDECRIPVDRRLVVTRTRDGGESFETLSAGLPEVPSFDLVYRHGFDLDPAGGRLAMGSTTGNLWIGDDFGETWLPVANHLPPIAQVVWSQAG
ncbi:MAG: hypothetical protein WD470_10190 [Rhodospirillaceae bacterium]